MHKVLCDYLQRMGRSRKETVFSRGLKRFLPFDGCPEHPWNKHPKLDAPLSKVSKKAALALEDMGSLQDAMDQKIDLVLKRALDSTMANLRLALATTYVDRNPEFSLGPLLAHLEAGSPREELVDSFFPRLFKAVAYIADASVESVPMSARSSVLANSVRRALWFKTWSRDAASKLRLCRLPISGDLLFGSELVFILERKVD